MDDCSKTLLASFCNLGTVQRTGLVKVDLVSEQIVPIELGFPNGVISCTGLTKDSSRIYVIFESEGAGYVAALQLGSLQPLFYQSLPEVKDSHSILVAGGYLYVVSTGSDEVLRYELTEDRVDNPQVIWRANTSGSDSHHVNSITEWNGSLVIAAFGLKFGSLWSSASDGYIHDIDRGICIRSGIYHPHSLSVHEKSLYWCESQRRLFWCLDGPIACLDGYARGICWLSDQTVCVGTSVGRKHSKSTGLVGNPADPGESTGSCVVSMIDIASGRHEKRLDLTWVGREIYDLLPLED